MQVQYHSRHEIFQASLPAQRLGQPYSIYAKNGDPANSSGVRMEVSALKHGRVGIRIVTGRGATLRVLDEIEKVNPLGIELLARCLLTYWIARESRNG